VHFGQDFTDVFFDGLNSDCSGALPPRQVIFMLAKNKLQKNFKVLFSVIGLAV
jgi:hypothetical protein